MLGTPAMGERSGPLLPGRRRGSSYVPAAPFAIRARSMPARIVLVVEDDPDLLELLTGAFVDCGFQACGARLLIEAQRLVADLRFDLIIVDMSLPDGTGIELITWLRSLSVEQGRQTPCLAITGHQSLGVTAVAAGFRATLHKPLDVRALVKVAAAVLSDSAPPPSQL